MNATQKLSLIGSLKRLNTGITPSEAECKRMEREEWKIQVINRLAKLRLTGYDVLYPSEWRHWTGVLDAIERVEAKRNIRRDPTAV